MGNNTAAAAAEAAEAAREWIALIDRAQADLQRGAMGPADGSQAALARASIERAGAVIDALARGEEAIKAEFPGAPLAPMAAGTLEQWMHDGAAPKEPKRKAVSTALRDTPPKDALRTAKQSRDAVLRLGLWSTLGDAAGAASCTALVSYCRRAGGGVPPGIAPTPGWAESVDAEAFFCGHLREVMAELARAGEGRGVAFEVFSAPLEALPMNRTVALAQRWSAHWSDAVCGVYADWLDRRGNGSIGSARASLWQGNGDHNPVRFRPGPGLAAIPTKGHRIHVDLWLQAVLAQVLAHDPTRWNEPAVDGRWHAVRLAIHDLAARDVGDAAGMTRTLHRGLSIEMLYAAIFIDRAAAAKDALMNADAPAPAPEASCHFDVAVPGCADGQQATLRVILEWGRSQGAFGASRRREPAPATDLSSAQRATIRAWKAQREQRADDVKSLDPARLAWQAAAAPGQDSPLFVLGHGDLWGAIDASALWLDIAVIAHRADHWTVLPVDLVDEQVDGRLRTWLALDASDVAVLHDQGIDVQQLQERLASAASSLWVARKAGLGVFVSIGIELAP